MTYIMIALGWILNLFYQIIGNYGFSIILFTVFIKLVLLPLDLKQKRSMAKTQKIQPLLMEIQKKYANDKEKQSQETMKLYQKYGINPMSGCLPMLIQLPIIFALYWVVRKPIAYMMGVSTADIWRIGEAFNVWAAQNLSSLPEKIQAIIPVTYEKATKLNTFGLNEIQIAQLLFKNPEILNYPSITSWDRVLEPINFAFFGMDLSDIPNLNSFLGIFIGKFQGVTKSTVLLWIIPLLSGFSSWLSSKISSASASGDAGKKKDKNLVLSEEEKANTKTNSAGDTMKTMTAIMPLFSTWFAFTLPAAVGLYWTTSNVIQIIQHIWVTKYLKTDISDEDIEGEINNVKSRKNRKKRK